MDNIIMYCIIGVICVALLAVIVYYIIKIVKMTPEERKRMLVTYLKGAIALAERELGSGQGKAKLQEVELYFKKHAPWLLKILLKITKTDNLESLIEIALSEIKQDFGG